MLVEVQVVAVIYGDKKIGRKLLPVADWFTSNVTSNPTELLR